MDRQGETRDPTVLLWGERLEITELPIGDIADAVSYASHSNCGEAFRRWSGATPSDWQSNPTADVLLDS